MRVAKGFITAISVTAISAALLVVAESVPTAHAVPADVVRTAQMAGYWTFDNQAALGTPAVAGGVLTAYPGATYTSAGKFGGGLQLDGISGKLFVSAPPTWVPTGNSAYSVSAWFKSSAYNMGGIVGWGNYGGSGTTNALRLSEGTVSLINYWWSNDLNCKVSCGWSLNSWHHVATSYDGTTRKIYLDGALKATDTPGAAAVTNGNFAIGVTA